jgi:hypothetical protein
MYDPGIWLWSVEIHVKNSPQIILLDKRGLLRHSFDWFSCWHVHVGLGRVGVSYDENAHQRYGWELRNRYSRGRIVRVWDR